MYVLPLLERTSRANRGIRDEVFWNSTNDDDDQGKWLKGIEVLCPKKYMWTLQKVQGKMELKDKFWCEMLKSTYMRGYQSSVRMCVMKILHTDFCSFCTQIYLLIPIYMNFLKYPHAK